MDLAKQQLERMKESFLWAAAKGGGYEEVESLLAIGASVEWVSAEGDTALVAACRQGHEEIVSLLLAHGSDVSKGDPLHVCCRRGDEALCKLLIDAGADVDATDARGETAFEAAAAAGYGEIVCHLRSLAARHREATVLPALPMTQRKHPEEPQRTFVLQLEAARRSLREEKAGRDADRRRVAGLETQSTQLLDDLLAARATADRLGAECDRLRAELKQRQGYDLHGMSVDELAALEDDVAAAARRIARYREKLLVAAVKLPDAFICSITRELLQDPVTCSDGHTYERRAIAHWLVAHDTSPKTGLPLDSKHLVPNYAIRSAIDEHRRLVATAAAAAAAAAAAECDHASRTDHAWSQDDVP
ncbi:hypothetical protein CTAYLR_006682 [Chrysophaeum taylorii]|uniref:U-box domain-containing protein n=1 Tax=Chrysophaeum taylorii TaxID=2483200 RepID=A0AAD7UDG7_9STRA|nr:hypothetical protein CTAYLR_006682 [Chrysophaeum taylorii]